MGVNPREGRRAGGTCREVPSGEGVCDGRTASVSVGLAQQREMCVTQRQLEEQSARLQLEEQAAAWGCGDGLQQTSVVLQDLWGGSKDGALRVDSRACRVYRNRYPQDMWHPTVCFLTEEARWSSKDESGNKV